MDIEVERRSGLGGDPERWAAVGRRDDRDGERRDVVQLRIEAPAAGQVNDRALEVDLKEAVIRFGLRIVGKAGGRQSRQSERILAVQVGLGVKARGQVMAPNPNLFHGFSVVALALAIAGCGSASHNKDGDENQSAAIGAAGRGVSEARAYIAQFFKKDPETCFKKDVQFEQPRLVAPTGIGPLVPPTRVIIMIDGSGSMAGRIGGQTKLELARQAALGFVDGLPQSVPASLLVFGQQGNNQAAGKTKSCSAIDVLAPLSTNRQQLRTALQGVHAVGWTPLAAGLDRAESLLTASPTPGEQIIYVVSDGEETCGGDPVASANRINSGRTRAIVNIIGFNLPSSEAAHLASVAKAGGGKFVNAANKDELDRIFEQVRETNRKILNDVRMTSATNVNDVRAVSAINNADVCITSLVNVEDTAMTSDLNVRDTRGQPVAFRAQAEALLKARHDELRARLEDYRARLSSAQAAAKRGIDAAAEAAR